MQPRDDSLLLDILVAARTIARYTGSVSQSEFRDNQVLQDAVIRQIGIIGEAASRVSDGLKDAHPEIPSHEIVGMRHRLVHDYQRVDLSRVWKAARESVPELIELVEPIVPPETSEWPAPGTDSFPP